MTKTAPKKTPPPMRAPYAPEPVWIVNTDGDVHTFDFRTATFSK
jgi:hypothetical protein